MSDIVERLREADGWTANCGRCKQAADVIKSLRTRVKESAQEIDRLYAEKDALAEALETLVAVYERYVPSKHHQPIALAKANAALKLAKGEKP